MPTIKPPWLKFAGSTFVLFVVGAFISRSLVNLALYLIAAGSIGVLISMLISNRSLDSNESGVIHQKYKSRHYIWMVSFFVYLITNSVVIYLVITGYSLKTALLFLVAVTIPICVWLVGIYKKVFTLKELAWWLWLNGILLWFYLAFLFRKVDYNSSFYLNNILHLSMGLSLPTTFYYSILKLSGFSTYSKIKFKQWFALLLGAVAILSLMGIPSLIGLNNYWSTWFDIAQKLDISVNNGRLSSFHFVLDLGNILAQTAMLMLGLLLYQYHLKNRDVKKISQLLVITIAVVVLFVTTWVKLLIPVFVVLLASLLVVAFRKNLKYIALSAIALLGGLVILLNTDVFSKLLDDSKKFSTVVQQNYEQGTLGKTVLHLSKSELHYSASFIYRLQHYLWASRIIKTHTLMGVGPYAYTDYVVENFKNEYALLPYSFREPVSEEELKDIEKLRPKLNMAILSTHADFVMVASSGGLIGILLYYSMFVVLIVYFLRRYFSSDNHLYLGVGFALLVMLGSGLTEPNFKSIHMYLLSFYGLVFLFDKFLLDKNTNDQKI